LQNFSGFQAGIGRFEGLQASAQADHGLAMDLAHA
jgi:hypothetical protein